MGNHTSRMAAWVGLHVRSVVDTGAAYGTTPAAIQREWRSKGEPPTSLTLN